MEARELAQGLGSVLVRGLVGHLGLDSHYLGECHDRIVIPMKARLVHASLRVVGQSTISEDMTRRYSRARQYLRVDSQMVTVDVS
jgi:hypothetical protein